MSFSIFLFLITVVCVLLIIVIMVQNPKGGGLSSSFGGTQQLGGVQKTTDFLDKSTWTLGIVLIVLILLSSLSDFGQTNNITIDKGAATPVAAPVQQPLTPAATPTPAEGEASSETNQ
ncbi:preprotein translocase subunit SecG [Flavobacterium orientale]|uniref:Protein-export membrane protein SecG n=1 Tax=Flavobacterium orientale TaxID=1756020 RepID=A0A916XVK8_9FLAO|nr:preprotein translocase subunit SecG [Flavobacterium orientale]GGD13895.1 preprotein translocase subunit SecG [Flavobacterium orientale]